MGDAGRQFDEEADGHELIGEEAKLGVVELVAVHGALVPGAGCFLRGQRLQGNGFLVPEGFGALEVEAGIFERGLVACELAFGLRDLNCVSLRVDFGEDMPSLTSWRWVKRTFMSWPSTRLFTITVENGVTVPGPFG